MAEDRLVILHVEDNADHARLVERTLRGRLNGTSFHLVEDGQAALDFLFRRRPFEQCPRPDLILLDLRLPKIGGIEVLKTVKMTPALRDIPVVVLTSSAAEWDIARAYENYANSYLVKPVRFEAFRDMMEQLGLYWRKWNRFLNREEPGEV